MTTKRGYRPNIFLCKWTRKKPKNEYFHISVEIASPYTVKRKSTATDNGRMNEREFLFICKRREVDIKKTETRPLPQYPKTKAFHITATSEPVDLITVYLKGVSPEYLIQLHFKTDFYQPTQASVASSYIAF
jgi:hypothetical protein